MNNPIKYTDPSGHSPSDGCDYEGCLSDPDTWGVNFITYLTLNGTEDNSVGAFIDHFFWGSIETLSAAEANDIAVLEGIARGAIDSGTSYVRDIERRLGFDPSSAWQTQVGLGDAFIAGFFLTLDTNDNGLYPGQSGSYRDLRKLQSRSRGKGLSIHHMPQKAMNYTSEMDGGALVMTTAEHYQTRTYGRKGGDVGSAGCGQILP